MMGIRCSYVYIEKVVMYKSNIEVCFIILTEMFVHFGKVCFLTANIYADRHTGKSTISSS